MPLSKNEFSVMTALLDGSCSSQRQVAQRCGLSLGLVNEVYNALLAAGLVKGFTVTDQGMKRLAPYQVKNAVILAAGLSSRLAPISYDRPKGALRVRGEVLIERRSGSSKRPALTRSPWWWATRRMSTSTLRTSLACG